jgi:hypothetical protein
MLIFIDNPANRNPTTDRTSWRCIYPNFEMEITFVLWLTALRLSKTTTQVSNLIYLTPFLALPFISIFIGESILTSTVIGLLFKVA